MKVLKIENSREKGITLIALVVTIIVLIILATVSISMVTGENGLIKKAEQARAAYENSAQREDASMNELLKEIAEVDVPDDPPSDPSTVKEAVASGTVFSETTKITDDENKEMWVPKDFKVVEGDRIDDGVVIEDGEQNQFVWVPVPNPEEMYGEDADNNGKYLGKLYDFNSGKATPFYWVDAGNGKIRWKDKTNYREPDILTGSEYDSNQENLNLVVEDTSKTQGKFKEQLQNEFKDMCDSVAKYYGFYVGRYETSLTEYSDKSASKKGVDVSTSANNKNWYYKYTYNKAYAPKGGNSSVVSSTIWGSQYDAMLKWMQSNGIDVTSTTPKTGVEGNKTRITGDSNSKDKLCNIYDLLGNSFEWTMEAINTATRVARGSMSGSLPPCRRLIDDRPTYAVNDYSARLSLYLT